MNRMHLRMYFYMLCSLQNWLRNAFRGWHLCEGARKIVSNAPFAQNSNDVSSVSMEYKMESRASDLSR